MQISHVFFSVYLSQDSHTDNLSAATARGATVGSSSNLLAVSLMEAAKLRLQHSGEFSVIVLANLLKVDRCVIRVLDATVEVAGIWVSFRVQNHSPVEVAVRIPSNPALKRTRMNRNVSHENVVERPTPENVVKVRGVVGELEQIVVTPNQFLAPIQPFQHLETASVDDNVTKVINAIFGPHNPVPIVNEGLGHFLRVIPGAHLGSVIPQKLADSGVAKVRIRCDPSVCHTLFSLVPKTVKHVKQRDYYVGLVVPVNRR